MKQLARTIVVAILSWQVRRLRRKNAFKIVGVVGSIGKTSTKRAIAEVLSAEQRVRYQSGNYNDLATVPLALFGQPMPALFNPFGWLGVFLSNELQLAKAYPYDTAVVELGTDGPGQIAAFARYLHLDLAVVTGLTPEHMEFFKDLDAVVAEELSVADYADRVIVNADFAAEQYLNSLTNPVTYGIDSSADYRATDIAYGEVTKLHVAKNGAAYADLAISAFSSAQIYSLLAATVVWDLLGQEKSKLPEALSKITAVPGRMQMLEGVRGIKIIDDSYNASPEAMKAALDTLYQMQATHKVALLGNMNELGDFGIEAHREIGAYCDPARLDEVLTLGPEANEYLAPAAEKRGCKVTVFQSPYTAGEYLASSLPDGAAVLIKGSQNRVFAEEAIKSLLRNPVDESRLVRQSKDWLEIKTKQFTR